MNVLKSLTNVFFPTKQKHLVRQQKNQLIKHDKERVYVPNEVINPTLSYLMLVGRQYHPLCRDAFVERVSIGYYAYERRYEWKTCAIAAAYAGAFGAESIERPDFSYSMAVYRLSKLIGYDMHKLRMNLPTGTQMPLDEGIMSLVDNHLWTRQGVAELLMDNGL